MDPIKALDMFIFMAHYLFFFLVDEVVDLMYSLAKMALSDIRLLWTKAACSSPIHLGKRGFRRLIKSLVMILL